MKKEKRVEVQKRGDIAQLGERRLCTAEVRGSSPLVSIEERDKPKQRAKIKTILLDEKQKNIQVFKWIKNCFKKLTILS